MADKNVGDLVGLVQRKGFSRRDSRRAVKALFDAMKAALVRGEKVETPVGRLSFRTINRTTRTRYVRDSRNLKGHWTVVLVRKFPNKVIEFRPSVAFYE